MSGDDSGQKADRGFVRLPVRHLGGCLMTVVGMVSKADLVEVKDL